MAKKIEREVVKASSAKKETKKAKAPKREAKAEEREVVEVKDGGDKKTRKKRATGKRLLAVFFWLLAIAAEVICILRLNGYLYWLPQFDIKTFIIAGLGIDLLFVIIGSLFWKKANRINPPSEKNKLWFFLCSQMGLIVALIAFVPLVVFLLKDKNLDKKTKKIVSVIAAIALLIAGAASIDYNPASAEDLAEAKSEAAELGYGDVVYWTQYGRSYHLDQDCHTLARSKVLYEGSMDESFEAKRNDPCDYCADGDALRASAEVEEGGLLEDVVEEVVEEVVE
ncbi:MAG: hypothetical protein IJC24_06720 [Clostridia bacterium]|nr:hypothetical protein [Clostridia bacterium]